MKLIKHYSFYSQRTKNERLALFTNAFFATTGFLSFFIGYRYLPLPDLTTIRYTQVVWTVLIVIIMYREKPSIPTVFAMILTTVGVVLVAQPGFLFRKKVDLNTSDDHSQRLTGLLIALYCSLAMSIMVISNKILLTKYKVEHSLVLFQFAFLSLIAIIIHLFYSYFLRPNPIESLKKLFLLGIISVHHSLVYYKCLHRCLSKKPLNVNIRPYLPSFNRVIFYFLFSYKIFSLLSNRIFYQ